jgi:hypothetical protein
MSAFTEAFRGAAQSFLDTWPRIQYEWHSPLILKIAASSPSGFDVKLVCESYGLYPYAGTGTAPRGTQRFGNRRSSRLRSGSSCSPCSHRSERYEFTTPMIVPTDGRSNTPSRGPWSRSKQSTSSLTGLGHRSEKIFRNEWTAAA